MKNSSSIMAFIIAFSINSSQHLFALEANGDIFAHSKTPGGFLISALVDTTNSEILRNSYPLENPLFIVFEGRQSPLEWNPIGEKSSKFFSLDSKNSPIIPSIIEELEKQDPNLDVELKDNTLIVSDKSLKSTPQWALDTVVEESKTRDLTLGFSLELLKEKYRMSNPTGIFDGCDMNEVVTTSGLSLTVRDLLLKMLKQAAIHSYQASEAKNWIGYYQISNDSIKNYGEPANFVVVKIITR